MNYILNNTATGLNLFCTRLSEDGYYSLALSLSLDEDIRKYQWEKIEDGTVDDNIFIYFKNVDLNLYMVVMDSCEIIDGITYYNIAATHPSQLKKPTLLFLKETTFSGIFNIFDAASQSQLVVRNNLSGLPTPYMMVKDPIIPPSASDEWALVLSR